VDKVDFLRVHKVVKAMQVLQEEVVHKVLRVIQVLQEVVVHKVLKDQEADQAVQVPKGHKVRQDLQILDSRKILDQLKLLYQKYKK
jgi:hypothetical protein